MRMIHAAGALDELPTLAVRVYQEINGWWFRSGDPLGYHSRQITLPARLLDDGL